MKTADYAFQVASNLQNAGEFKAALSILNSILEGMPKHEHAWHLSGVIYFQLNDVAKAIECIEKAIYINPNVSIFYSNLGEMQRILKNIDISISYNECAVRLQPNSAVALSNLGIAYYDAKQYDKAENCHKRALEIHPSFPASLNNLGSIYKVLNKTTEAIFYYKATLNVAPDHIDSLNNLAIICMEQHDYISAEHYMKKVLALSPQHIKGHQHLAEIYHAQGKHAQSLKYIDQAISLDERNENLYLSKGNILMEMGEVDEAASQFLEVSKSAEIGQQILSQYSLVQLRKTEMNSEFLNTLHTFIHAKNVPEDKLEYVYFALGKCYDDLNEYKKSFQYFNKGCSLKRARINYEPNSEIQFTNQLIQIFNTDTIDFLKSFSDPSCVPIFIVGMPRSGTTLVEQILANHPKVHGGGELPYMNFLMQNVLKTFDGHLSKNLIQNHCADMAHTYLGFLRNISKDAPHITDKLPQNFIAIGLIHALFPNAKIIHVKRHPLDSCLSCYTKLFSHGHYYSYDLTELGQYYNCYLRIMDHWRHILPSSAFLDVEYEYLIENFESETKRLISYLELEWDEQCLLFYESKREVRTASFMQVRKPIYTSSLNRFKRYENELDPLIKVLAQQQV